MEKIISFSPEQLRLIRETRVPAGTPVPEFQRFIHRAEALGLDPLADQIHLVSRNKREIRDGKESWTPTYQIIVGIDGFRAVADRTGKLAGIKRDVTLNAGKLTSAWAEVYRKDWSFPARAVVYMDEYVQTDRAGKPTAMWVKMPKSQLMKCAEAAAHRMAFPYLAGLYEPAEMEQADNPVSAPTLAPAPAQAFVPLVPAPKTPDLAPDPEPEPGTPKIGMAPAPETPDPEPDPDYPVERVLFGSAKHLFVVDEQVFRAVVFSDGTPGGVMALNTPETQGVFSAVQNLPAGRLYPVTIWEDFPVTERDDLPENVAAATIKTGRHEGVRPFVDGRLVLVGGIASGAA